MSNQDSQAQQSAEDKVQELKQRLLEDPEFRARVENDPVEVLLEAGLQARRNGRPISP